MNRSWNTSESIKNSILNGWSNSLRILKQKLVKPISITIYLRTSVTTFQSYSIWMRASTLKWKLTRQIKLMQISNKMLIKVYQAAWILLSTMMIIRTIKIKWLLILILIRTFATGKNAMTWTATTKVISKTMRSWILLSGMEKMSSLMKW